MRKFRNFATLQLSIMVSKTRDRLLEVARQLFMIKGVEHTTMNDIANASDRGRRTIYTYFKSKRDIYNAVVERESDMIVSRLRRVVDAPLPSEQKLRQYLYERFDIVSQWSVNRRSRHDHSLSGLFGRDSRRGERIYTLALSKEADLLKGLLDDGVAEGAFDRLQATRLPLLLQNMHINAPSAMIHTASGITDDNKQLIEFIVRGVSLRQ